MSKTRLPSLHVKAYNYTSVFLFSSVHLLLFSHYKFSLFLTLSAWIPPIWVYSFLLYFLSWLLLSISCFCFPLFVSWESRQVWSCSAAVSVILEVFLQYVIEPVSCLIRELSMIAARCDLFAKLVYRNLCFLQIWKSLRFPSRASYLHLFAKYRAPSFIAIIISLVCFAPFASQSSNVGNVGI